MVPIKNIFTCAVKNQYFMWVYSIKYYLRLCLNISISSIFNNFDCKFTIPVSTCVMDYFRESYVNNANSFIFITSEQIGCVKFYSVFVNTTEKDWAILILYIFDMCCVSFRFKFRVVVFGCGFRCGFSVRLYIQLFVGGLMSCLRYFCLRIVVSNT